MSDATRYPVPASRGRAEHVIDRSRFICTLQRARSPEEAQEFVREMKQEFAAATHNCWAFVAGPPGSTGRIGMSDDGEPHGTAGRPMLTVLLHSGVGEVAGVVTRYYGGTKLGTGGLVRAYSAAVQAALEMLPRIERVELREIGVTVGYAHISAVLHALPAVEAEMVSETYDVDVHYRIRVPVERLDALRAALSNATGGQVEIAEPQQPAE
ncbi:MAG: YigZ family protein [Gemmatimonadaceae bacterium]